MIAPTVRFLKHVDKKGPYCIALRSRCWQWKGGQIRGYGGFRLDGKLTGAHRVSWKLFKGPIPDGLCVLHECDNKLCVNPDHLFTGTQKQNSENMVGKNRHAAGTKHPLAKLDNDKVRYIWKTYRPYTKGSGTGAIAAKLGVSRRAVRNVLNRQSWTGVS